MALLIIQHKPSIQVGKVLKLKNLFVFSWKMFTFAVRMRV